MAASRPRLGVTKFEISMMALAGFMPWLVWRLMPECCVGWVDARPASGTSRANCTLVAIGCSRCVYNREVAGRRRPIDVLKAYVSHGSVPGA